jgi:hypothetical protein
MTQMTVVTDAKGQITVIAQGHVGEPSAHGAAGRKPLGGVRAGPGETLHEIDHPDDLTKIADFAELAKRLKPHLKSH